MFTNRTRVQDFDARHGPPDYMRGHATTNDFDFWQLGHDNILDDRTGSFAPSPG